MATALVPQPLPKKSGPRKQRHIQARVTQHVFEILKAAFSVQQSGHRYGRDTEIVCEESAGEVLESYAMDTCPLLFGMTYQEYALKRESGQNVNLEALYRRNLLECL